MHKKLFMLCLIMAATCPAYAYKVKTFQPLQPAYVNPVQQYQNNYQNAMPAENYPRITQIEFSLFRRTFETENIYSRLTRIENNMFKRNFVNLPLASRVDNITANVDAGLMYGISQKELIRLEKKVLGQTFLNDDTASRITRLEKEMLGAMQNGNLAERFNTVKTASQHYNSYPEIARSQAGYGNTGYYNQRPINSGVNGVIQNILGSVFGNFGAGSMTGSTPPIYDPYNQYSQYGGVNPGMGMQDYYMGNTGGHLDNRNIGNSSSVRILD